MQPGPHPAARPGGGEHESGTRAPRRPEVSLVLGGGGARGLAHIGVIRWIEEQGLTISRVAGTSMGALVGGIHAAGKLPIYSDWACALQRLDIVRLLDWSLSRYSLFKGERIIEVLRELVGDHRIEDLPVRFTAVATDLNRQREVWLSDGPLFDAIRASIAVPLLFSPVERGGRLLVDGGLTNPLPIAPTLNDETDMVIAVDLNASYDLDLERRAAEASQVAASSAYGQRIRTFIDSLFAAAGARPEREPAKAVSETPDAIMLLSRTMDTLQSTLTRFKLAGYRPDGVVQVPRNVCTFFEFHRAAELIEFGYQQAERDLRGPVQQFALKGATETSTAGQPPLPGA